MAKDPKTNQKSITVTLLFLTFILVVVAVVCRIYGILEDSGVIYAALAFHIPYIAVYWQKRIKAGPSGIEFSEKE